MRSMKTLIFVAVSFVGISTSAFAIQVLDVIQSPTGFFVPTDAQKYDYPYYRWYNQDWGWTHTPLADSYTSASLLISAFDVDWLYGEMDVVAIVNGAPVVLGQLQGVNDQWSYATFDVTAFGAQIAAGLQVWIDIDTGHTEPWWAVTLAKSVLTLDGATPPPPPPQPHPTPDGGSSLALLGLGVLGLRAFKKYIGK